MIKCAPIISLTRYKKIYNTCSNISVAVLCSKRYNVTCSASQHTTPGNNSSVAVVWRTRYNACCNNILIKRCHFKAFLNRLEVEHRIAAGAPLQNCFVVLDPCVTTKYLSTRIAALFNYLGKKTKIMCLFHSHIF